jgi:hypothetical protein
MQALSQLAPDFTFLEGSQSGNVSLLPTPLEENQNKYAGFAGYTTGTLKFNVSPEQVNQCSALRTLEVTAYLQKLAKIVCQLQQNLNKDDIVAIVKPTLIAEQIPYIENVNDLTEDVIQRSVDKIESIDYFPTIEGLPIWERLGGERIDFYNVFKMYRDMRYSMLDNGEYVILRRTIGGLATMLSLPGKLLTTLAKLYSWTDRCTLYDRYMEVQIQKRRQQQIQILESDHLKAANALFKTATEFLTKQANNITPKDAISLAELAFKMSRVSLGLQGDKPGSSVAANQTTLSIYNTTTNNKADQMMNVNASIGGNTQGGASAVERQLQENLKDEKNLLSILHVLQASGAMATAVNSELVDDGIIDAPIVEEDDING